MQNPRASADELNRAMEVSNRVMVDMAENSRRAHAGFDEMINPIAKAATQASNMAKSIENLRQRILFLFSATSIFYKIRTELNKTFESVKQLDKSFASIAMVTDKTLSDMWAQYDKYADMATKLGQSTNDMIQASALFYQQGLDTNEALQLTTDTMKLATLAGSDFSTATKEMTSTIHGFNMAMNEGSHITDVYSELAAHAAASVDEIAKAMERTASIANSAGMSFENTSVFLTHMLETTQEGAENIGTSLKTIIARFGELKNNVSAADSEFDDLDLNKVDKALKSVGVQLKDENLQFRDLDQVLLELSGKWSSLDRNTQRYIATIAAGSRQQSRFLALMDGYDRTVELMETAAEAEGKADQQFAKYADTVEYRLKQLQTKWEEFKVSIVGSDLWKGLLTTASGLLDRLNGVDTKRLVIGTTMGIFIGRTLISSLTK
jgi:TP901 family phage tail tape measure protein